MEPKEAFIVSVARGCVISELLILLLLRFADPNSIWLVMPVTELVTTVYVMRQMGRYTRELGR